MKTLLIGGTNDGERIVIPEEYGNHFFMRCKDQHKGWHDWDESPQAEVVCQTEKYYRAKIGGSSKAFEVFSAKGMNGDRIIERLISNYKP